MNMTGDWKTNMGVTTDRPAEVAFRTLLRAYGLIQHVMQSYFKQFGISGSQWGVLRTLHRAEKEKPAGLRLSELGGRLLVRPPSVTGVVGRLLRLGLVSRNVAPEDQRAKQVALTAAGRELVERILRGHAAQIQSLMSGLAAEEQAELYRLLDRLSSELRAMVEREESTIAG